MPLVSNLIVGQTEPGSNILLRIIGLMYRSPTIRMVWLIDHTSSSAPNGQSLSEIASADGLPPMAWMVARTSATSVA